MSEWNLRRFLSLRAKHQERSKLISMQQEGEMKMPQGMTSMSKEMGMNGRGGNLDRKSVV